MDLLLPATSHATVKKPPPSTHFTDLSCLNNLESQQPHNQIELVAAMPLSISRQPSYQKPGGLQSDEAYVLAHGLDTVLGEVVLRYGAVYNPTQAAEQGGPPLTYRGVPTNDVMQLLARVVLDCSTTRKHKERELTDLKARIWREVVAPLHSDSQQAAQQGAPHSTANGSAESPDSVSVRARLRAFREQLYSHVLDLPEIESWAVYTWCDDTLAWAETRESFTEECACFVVRWADCPVSEVPRPREMEATLEELRRLFAMLPPSVQVSPVVADLMHHATLLPCGAALCPHLASLTNSTHAVVSLLEMADVLPQGLSEESLASVGFSTLMDAFRRGGPALRTQLLHMAKDEVARAFPPPLPVSEEAESEGEAVPAPAS